MDNLRKVRCPHCKTINSVDITSELKKHEEVVIKKILSDPNINKYIPKSIEVICTHCKKPFKINI